MINYHSFKLSDEWRTPIDLFNLYNSIYHFDLDACASDDNHLCDYYFTKKNSALNNKWFGNVWINPPYSDIYPFVEKAYNYNGLSVLLLPARTDSKWFHNFIINNAEIIFLQGRLKFSDSKQNAPFPSMVCIFKDVKFMKSISPETLKAVKNACIDFRQHMDYLRNQTEICNDNYVFPRLALLCSLCDQVISNIHE